MKSNSHTALITKLTPLGRDPRELQGKSNAELRAIMAENHDKLEAIASENRRIAQEQHDRLEAEKGRQRRKAQAQARRAEYQVHQFAAEKFRLRVIEKPLPPIPTPPAPATPEVEELRKNIRACVRTIQEIGKLSQYGGQEFTTKAMQVSSAREYLSAAREELKALEAAQ